MVGRKVRLELDKAPPGTARPLLTAAACRWSIGRGVRLLDDVDARAARRRDRRHRRCLGQRPDRAAAGPVGHSAADRRRAATSAAATSMPTIPSIRPRCVSSASRMCRRIACARGMVAGLPGVGDVDPRLSGRSRLLPQLSAGWAGAVGAALRRADGALRRAAARAGAALVELLRRQPAEADPGARDGARAQGAAGRPADARRRYRRHRVHPPRAGRRAATRAAPSWSSRSSSTRSCRWPIASW